MTNAASGRWDAGGRPSWLGILAVAPESQAERTDRKAVHLQEVGATQDRSPSRIAKRQKSICALNFTNRGCSTDVGASQAPFATNVWL